MNCLYAPAMSVRLQPGLAYSSVPQTSAVVRDAASCTVRLSELPAAAAAAENCSSQNEPYKKHNDQKEAKELSKKNVYVIYVSVLNLFLLPY